MVTEIQQIIDYYYFITLIKWQWIELERSRRY